MSPKDITPHNDMQALERRLETLELTLGELVAIHRRIEQTIADSILMKPRRG